MTDHEIRWREVSRLYHAALELPPESRSEFLADACSDAAIRSEIEALLGHDARADDFLREPALALAAQMASLPAGEGPRARLGRYELAGLLGKGGMGEVYRARDVSLGRDVAIKMLPPAFSTDPDRMARFDREARVLAALNHPNIGAIYGVEQEAGSHRRALVLELVEGETLAQRLARGPLPLDEARAIATQIAGALEAAHEKTIVHRDLKPGNVALTAGGMVKVLDFGLAKAVSGHVVPAGVTAMSSIAATAQGFIVGTPSYMSPEQARGAPVDQRTDIWAFGCVLYEMLTARPAFDGVTHSDTLAAVLERAPDWDALPAETPSSLRRLLHWCLEKNPNRRLHDIADARFDLEGAAVEADDSRQPVATRLRPAERLGWAALSVVALGGAVLAWLPLRDSPPLRESDVRFEIVTPQTSDPSIAISPDGQSIAFVGVDRGQSRVWLRPLNSLSARPLAGTDGAAAPFWSPDSRSIGFFADGKLKRIDIDTGLVRELANAALGAGGTWSREGVILYGFITGADRIVRVPDTGGEPVPVTPPDQRGAFGPRFLPDGRHFFYQAGGPDRRSPGAQGPSVYVARLDGGEPRRVLASSSPPVFVSSGQVLFVRDGTLFAQDFDVARLELSGTAYPVADGVQPGILSASPTGSIVFRTGASTASLNQPSQLVWFDRAGNEIERIGDPSQGAIINPSLSPVDGRVAISRAGDIWLVDPLKGGAAARFTTAAGADNNPLWSSNGTQIVFSSNRGGVLDLWVRDVTDAVGSERPLLESPHTKSASDWSRDGRFLLYETVHPETLGDIWALPLDAGGREFAVARTRFYERDGQFSPGGKWVAYESNESGVPEIYIQPFPPTGGKEPISVGGGTQARWRRDGQELFYLAPDSRLMAVSIRLPSSRERVEVSAPVPLFVAPVAVRWNNLRHQYEVAGDGQRFLVNTAVGGHESSISVIVNWKPRP